MDKIERMILDDGYIPNNHIWRRSVMIQTLRHCMGSDMSSQFNRYFVESTPYRYQWETAINEIRVLSKIKDRKEKTDRSRFFNKHTVLEMLYDYVEQTKDPTAEKIYEDITKQNLTYQQLQKPIQQLMKKCPMPNSLKKSDEWISAFAKTGFYNTVTYLIKFEHCRFFQCNNILSEKESLDLADIYVSDKEKSYNDLYRIMQDFIESNCGKIPGWRKTNKNEGDT